MVHIILITLLVLDGLTLMRVAQAQTVQVSVKLTDTIAKGVGDVDLQKNIDPALLEGYRASYGSKTGIAK